MYNCGNLITYLSVLGNDIIDEVLINNILDINKLIFLLDIPSSINSNCNDILEYLLQGCGFTDEIILLIAEDISNNEDCSSGECYNISVLLTNKLREYGIDAKNVGGYFQLDGIDKIHSDIDLIESRYLYHNDIMRPIHHWVKINLGNDQYKILDLTADQFKNELYDELPQTNSCYSNKLNQNYSIVYDTLENLPMYHELTKEEMRVNDLYVINEPVNYEEYFF